MGQRNSTSNPPKESKRYEYHWSNRLVLSDATDVGDMIGLLEDAATELREMKARGVVLKAGGGTGDSVTLITDDPAVAGEFGFDDMGAGACAQDASQAQAPADSRYRLVANLDRQEYFRMTSAWPVHLAVLRGELLPPGVTNSLLGSWRDCSVEVVASGQGQQSEAVIELLALQAIAGNGGGGTFYGEVRGTYRDVTGNLSWAITRLPQARELCYRLLAAPEDYSWLTLEEARRLIHGIATKTKCGFCTAFARWLAERPGLPPETRAVLSGGYPLAALPG